LVVYLAREAPIGVVLRRGPSAWVRLSVWHTDTDAFEHGQWFKGRVYERRCDVSADGSLFVYFARKTKARILAAHHADSWVAISRPPWFTALALWWVGSTYCAGGYFPDRRPPSAGGDFGQPSGNAASPKAQALWIGGSQPPAQGRLPSWLALTTHVPYVDRTISWSERTVYVNRLLRDGWQPVPQAPVDTWERRHPHRPLTLAMTHAGFDYGTYGVEYAVRTEPQAEAIPLGRATWADWDQRGRLVIARGGRLFSWQAAGTLQELADFNQQVPAPAPAPAWARAWPEGTQDKPASP
jgi:hypothetical protein